MLGIFRKQPRVRIPPSPTGLLHIGVARMALFNYLFAQQGRGWTVLRFEDTDRERSKKEYETDIEEGLSWLGITWDEKCRQSDRVDIYVKALKKLLDKGTAYVSKEPSKDDPSREVEVVRLRNPGKKIVFNDMIRGTIETDTSDLGNFVIARHVEDPLYHLAVVVDDGEMGITHIFRGEDILPSTARQLLIQEALGYSRPLYIHLPLILAGDRSKMSKRHGATGLAEYRAMGLLPEAMINFLAFLGWNPGTQQELFTMEELIKTFDVSKLNKSGAVFNMEKLLWFNREYLKRLSDEEFLKRLTDFSRTPMETPSPKFLPLLRERAATLAQARDMLSSPEFSFLGKTPDYSPALLLPKTREGTVSSEDARRHLETVRGLIEKVHEKDFSAEKIKDAIWQYATQEGRGAVLWPFRVALSGQERSPDPFTIASLIGKEETLYRLHVAVGKIS